MKLRYKIFLGVISFIILVNIIGFLIAFFTDTSLVLKIKPINRVYVFAHGNYVYFDNESYAHFTSINGEQMLTERLLDNLREEGFEKIWISMCEQGNSDYVYNYKDTKIKWGEDVSRVKKPGNVYPLYWGLGVYRFTLQKEDG